jgi:hypothetical protein
MARELLRRGLWLPASSSRCNSYTLCNFTGIIAPRVLQACFYQPLNDVLAAGVTDSIETNKKKSLNVA